MSTNFLFLIISCCLLGSNINVEERSIYTGQVIDTTSLIVDPDFSKGLTAKRVNMKSPAAFYLSDNFVGKPIWSVAEWGSKHFLAQSHRMVQDDLIVFENVGKSLRFQKMATTTQIGMKVVSSEEYKRPRQMNEDWPHLLIEQEFQYNPFIKDLKQLILKFNGKLLNSERKMSLEEYNTGLHTAQFQLFITVQNKNKQSAAYGDFLWFGIPFYDFRNEIIPLYAAQDIGKDDASGKFIYSIGSENFMKGSFHDKEWHKIDKDILPYIYQALELALERGYLKGSSIQDFQLSGMNLGWEVPGTFDVDFVFNGFDLLAVSNSK